MDVEDQYMDDLFGEGADNVSHHIATSASVPKGLPQRLDALAGNNCCSKIAWSRFGCIASTAANNRRLDLRLLVRSPKSGEWRLQKPTSIWPPLSSDTQEIVHLAFSAMGNDLAVVDSTGRIMLYSTGFTLTTLQLVWNSSSGGGSAGVNGAGGGGGGDELNDVVGLHWLPVFPHTQKTTVFWSASRNNDTWNVKSQQHQTPGPFNPLDGKSALVCLTRKGTLRLLWQARNAPWSETTVELGDAASAVEYSFTHAAFAPSKDSLYLAVYQLRRSLRLYQIKINWHMPPKTDNEQQNAAATPNPTLDVRGLTEEDAFCPLTLPNPHTDGIDATNGHHIDSSYSFNLSKLLFVPPAPDQGTREPTLHTVVGIFTVVPPNVSGNARMMADISAQWGQAASVIARWEVQAGLQDRISSCFDTLSNKKKGTSGIATRQRVRLQRLDDLSLAPAVLSLSPVRNNTMYALILSDGAVQFRHRETLDVVLPDDNTDEAQSLPQSGFVFPTIEPSLQTALSPGACIVATLQAENEVKLEKMQYLNENITDISQSEPKHDALAALFALQYTSACTQYKVTDDLLAILPANLSTSLTRATILLSIRFLNIDFDLLSADLQKQIFPLFRNHLAARCFSLQNALGSADKEGSRKLASRVAWVTLNLRHVSQNVMWNLSRADQALKPEMAISIVGLVKWSLDLCVYLLQELLNLFYALKHEATDRSADLDYIQGHMLARHSPALILLLVAMPRLFLRVSFRPLRYAYVHSQKGFSNTTLPTEQRGAFHKLLGVYGSTPVNHINLGALEEFVLGVEESVKNAFAAAGINAGQERQKVERDMFVTGTIPAVLLPAVTDLITKKLDTLMDKVDAGKVHVHDVSWLGFTDDAWTRRFCEGHPIDIVRKMPIAGLGSAKMRVCPRCGSVMEDIGTGPQGMQGHQPWVWQSHKVCVCFSSWASPEEEEEKKKAKK